MWLDKNAKKMVIVDIALPTRPQEKTQVLGPGDARLKRNGDDPCGPNRERRSDTIEVQHFLRRKLCS